MWGAIKLEARGDWDRLRNVESGWDALSMAGRWQCSLIHSLHNYLWGTCPRSNLWDPRDKGDKVLPCGSYWEWETHKTKGAKGHP